ncbi:MAG: hypothetical protein GY786_07390 [Proteobacteria bacterium]|nr:hypothetical protein [Pseudomonadota bacterium]
MSSIIETVSYKAEKSKDLLEKLSEHLGIHELKIHLVGGEVIEGIVSEVGRDYINILGENCDIVIPIHKISYLMARR